MALLNESFNTENLPQSDNQFEPIPAGWYTVRINSASLETTKAGTGQYIKCRYDVLGPTHEGRVLFGNLNISNPNPKAEEIGRQQLGDLMRAIGLNQVQDTDQLIGGECQVKVSVKDDPNYGPGNEVKGWKALAGGAPAQQAQQAAPSAAPAAAGGTAPPWAK